MNSINRLPNEVVLIICHYLSHKELQECLYLSKLWNKAVFPKYFEEMTLTRKKLDKWSQFFLFLNGNNNSIINRAAPYQKPFLINANRVLRLKVYQDEVEEVTAEDLIVILYNMPNIKEIELHQTRGGDGSVSMF